MSQNRLAAYATQFIHGTNSTFPHCPQPCLCTGAWAVCDGCWREVPGLSAAGWRAGVHQRQPRQHDWRLFPLWLHGWGCGNPPSACYRNTVAIDGRRGRYGPYPVGNRCAVQPQAGQSRIPWSAPAAAWHIPGVRLSQDCGIRTGPSRGRTGAGRHDFTRDRQGAANADRNRRQG